MYLDVKTEIHREINVQMSSKALLRSLIVNVTHYSNTQASLKSIIEQCRSDCLYSISTLLSVIFLLSIMVYAR